VGLPGSFLLEFSKLFKSVEDLVRLVVGVVLYVFENELHFFHSSFEPLFHFGLLRPFTLNLIRESYCLFSYYPLFAVDLILKFSNCFCLLSILLL